MTTVPTITISIEGAGFTFTDEYAPTDLPSARDAARRVAQYAMSQFSGTRRRSVRDDDTTSTTTDEV